MFKMNFSTENAAFDDRPEMEIADIFAQTMKRIRNGQKSGRVLDSFGNTIGEWSMTEEG